MTIASRIYNTNGVVILDRFGALQRVQETGAPNGVVFDADIVIVEGSPRSVIVTLDVADYSAYPTVVIGWLAEETDGTLVKGSTAFDPGAGGDIIISGSEEKVFGRAAGLTITGFELFAVDEDGLMGFSDGVHTIEAGAGNPIAPEIGTVTITGDGVEDEIHTAVAADVTGSPEPTLTYEWFSDGTTTGITTVTYTPPSPVSAPGITVTVTATNSAGEAERDSDPLVIVAADSVPVITGDTITGDGYIGSLHTVSYSVTGNPVPTVALQWQLDGSDISGETGTTYVTTNGGTLSCEIEATNTAGSDTAEPTIAISNVLALEEDEWDILTVEAEPSVSATARRWTSFYLDPVKAADRAWWTTHAPEVLASKAFPFGFVEMELTDAIEGIWDPGIAYNIAFTPDNANVGNGIASGTSTVTGPGSIVATATDATHFDITGLVTGTATVGTKFTSGAYSLTITAGSTAFEAGDILDGIVGSIDFSVFDPNPPGTSLADVIRQSRARVVYALASGARSPISIDQKTVPEIPTTVSNTWYPYMDRTTAEYNLGIIGGQGRQRFKNIARSAADPGAIWWGMDVNGGFMYSGDAGEFYTAPQLRGMTMQECSAGVWMDPADANRVLFAVSAAELRSTTTTANTFDLLAGIYQSTDGGHTATLVQQLTNLRDCGSPSERDYLRTFVEAPGGTPATRTIYFVHKPRPKAGTWGTGRIYKSTNGGATWAVFGESLTSAKFGSKCYWIDCAPNGDLYLGCDSGLFISTNGASTWTACTGIAGAVLMVNAYHGGTNVWACRDGNGAYKATNAAGTAFSRNTNLGTAGAYDICSISVCPANASRILVASNVAGTKGKWTHNGGTTWSDITHRSSTGATNDWASYMYGEGALFSWTPGSQTEVICGRAQEFGKSVDGGASTDWSGNGTDYQTRKGFGVDPTDWQIIISGTQDTIITGTMDGQNTANGSGHTAAQRTTLINGGSSMKGEGGLILANGSARAILTAAGGEVGQRLPIRHTPSGTNISNTITLIGSMRSGCEFAGLKTGDNSKGWMGKGFYELASNGTLTQTVMTQEFYGATLTGARIIGGPASPGNNRTLYVSTNSGSTWSTWGTSPVRFARVAGQPGPVCVSRFSNNRVWVGEAYNGSGRIYKMEGATPVNTLIFTLSSWPGFSSPINEIHVILEDPLDETILYVLAYAAGNSYIWRVTDALTTPVFEDITYNAPLRAISWMHIHPTTGDLVLGGQFGSRILRCRDDFSGPDAGKLFDRQKAFVDANIGPGVEF
jgi:hypothetical protein